MAKTASGYAQSINLMKNKMLVNRRIGFNFVSTQKCKNIIFKWTFLVETPREMSVDVHAVARVRAPKPERPNIDVLADALEGRDPPDAPRTLQSFGRRSRINFFVDKLPNTAKYPQNGPTRNLLGAGEMISQITNYSTTSEFTKFLDSHFTFGPKAAGGVDDRGNSFFHAVNMCLKGNETVDVSAGSQLRALAFEDKGELDMLRTARHDREKGNGVPVTCGITISALAKSLGICITVFKTAKSTFVKPKKSENFKKPETPNYPGRFTYSGDAGQCTADREIFLFKNDHGYQSLLPKSDLPVDVWDEFWNTILA